MDDPLAELEMPIVFDPYTANLTGNSLADGGNFIH